MWNQQDTQLLRFCLAIEYMKFKSFLGKEICINPINCGRVSGHRWCNWLILESLFMGGGSAGYSQSAIRVSGISFSHFRFFFFTSLQFCLKDILTLCIEHDYFNAVKACSKKFWDAVFSIEICAILFLAVFGWFISLALKIWQSVQMFGWAGPSIPKGSSEKKSPSRFC